MAKLVLEFNLPEERIEAQRAQQGFMLISVLWDFDQFLRDAIKHGSSGMDEGTMQIIRDRLYELLEDYNINLEDV